MENNIYEIITLNEAKEDINDLFQYIAADSKKNEMNVFQKIKQVISSLKEFPHRGNLISLLEDVGFTDLREIHMKPYRIFYKIIEKKVFVIAVMDGRRNIEVEMEKRMLMKLNLN